MPRDWYKLVLLARIMQMSRADTGADNIGDIQPSNKQQA